jgi:hypothetical protein
MDVLGARVLHKRLDQQAHWVQAEATRDGRQPRTDPDSSRLEELGDGVRFYGRAQDRRTLDGAPALVTRRLCKRIVGGRWETTFEIVSIERLGSADAAA